MTSPVTQITRPDLPGKRVREGRAKLQSRSVLSTFRSIPTGGPPKCLTGGNVFSLGHCVQTVVPADLCVRPMVLRHVVAPVLVLQP